MYDGNDELKVMVDTINIFSQKLNSTIHESKLTSLENISIASTLLSTSKSIHNSSQNSSVIVNETTI